MRSHLGEILKIGDQISLWMATPPCARDIMSNHLQTLAYHKSRSVPYVLQLP
jgi:hypothetical protein